MKLTTQQLDNHGLQRSAPTPSEHPAPSPFHIILDDGILTDNLTIDAAQPLEMCMRTWKLLAHCIWSLTQSSQHPYPPLGTVEWCNSSSSRGGSRMTFELLEAPSPPHSNHPPLPTPRKCSSDDDADLDRRSPCPGHILQHWLKLKSSKEKEDI